MIGETLERWPRSTTRRPLRGPRRRRPLHRPHGRHRRGQRVRRARARRRRRGKGPALWATIDGCSTPRRRRRRRCRRHRRRRHHRRSGLPPGDRGRAGRGAPRPCRVSTASATRASRPAPGSGRSPWRSRHHVRPLGRTTLGARAGSTATAWRSPPSARRRGRGRNHLTEDIEFQMELLLDGILVAYAPDAVVEARDAGDARGAQDAERAVGAWTARARQALRAATAPARGRPSRTAADRCRSTPPLDHLVPPLSVLVAAVGGVAVADSACRCCGGAGCRRSRWSCRGALVVHVLSGSSSAGCRGRCTARSLHAPEMILWKAASGCACSPGGARSAGCGRDVDRGRLVSQSRTAVVLGVPIDDVTIDEAVDRIAAMVDDGSGDGAGPPGRDGQRRLRRQRHATTASCGGSSSGTDLSIPDGMSVVWATRLLGTRPRANDRRRPPPGTGRTGRRCRIADRACSAAHPASPDRAATILRERHPGAASRPSRRRWSRRTARWTSPRSPDDPRRRRRHRVRRPRQPQAGAMDRPLRRSSRRTCLHRHRRHPRLPHRRHPSGAGVDAASRARVAAPHGVRAAPSHPSLRPRLQGVRASGRCVRRGGVGAVGQPLRHPWT